MAVAEQAPPNDPTTPGTDAPAEDKTFLVTTTAQIERTYEVKASDEDQAHSRVRTYIKDAGVLREGLVVPKGSRDTTGQKVIAKAQA